MRFATFSADGLVRAAVASDAGLHPLPDGTSVVQLVPAGLSDALEADRAALDGAAVPVAEVRLLPPLDPPTIRDFVAFEEHVEGVVASVGEDAGVVPEWYQAPTFYFTNPYALVGPYTILNDWSARDLQRREMKVSLGPAKGKDSATTLGPWLVTADEFEPYRDADGFLTLNMRVSVNGTETGQDLLSNMGWPFYDLISYASRGTWETFRDEVVDFAVRLWRCGGDAELHVWPGGFHGYDLIAPEAGISRDARAARQRWLARLLGTLTH